MSTYKQYGYRIQVDVDEKTIRLWSKAPSLSEKIQQLGSPTARQKGVEQHLKCNINRPGVRSAQLFQVKLGTDEVVRDINDAEKYPPGSLEPMLLILLCET